MEAHHGRKKVVMVLGMHRSGTSLLTRALSDLGVYLGSNLMEGLPDNPKGFFEDVEIVALNEEILRSKSCSWYSTCLPRFPITELESARDNAVRIINDRFRSCEVFAVKDPRITLLQNFWRSVFQELEIEIQYVLANRHPFGVAASLRKRDDMHRTLSLMLWLNYQVEGLRTLVSEGGVVVNYEEVIENRKVALQDLNAVLGIGLSDSEVENSDFVNSFVDASLFHHRIGGDVQFDTSLALESLCEEVYQVMTNAAVAGNVCGFVEQSSVYRIVDKYNEFINERQEFMRLMDDLYRDKRSLEKELRQSVRRFNESQPFYKKMYWGICKKIGM